MTPQTITTSDNDLAWDVTATSMLQLRFRLANASQFSCKLWVLVGATELQEGFLVEESAGRVRSPVYSTLLGSKIFHDLGVGKAALTRGWKFSETCTASQRSAISILQKSTRLFRDTNGNHYEVTLAATQPMVRWSGSAGVISSRSVVEAAIESVP